MPQVVMDKSLLPADLAEVIRPVPVLEGVVFQVPVAMSRLMRQLSNALFQAMQQLSVRDLPIEEQDVEEAFRYILAARCAYVSGVCKTVQHPKDVEYPTLLFPVLSAVGRWVDTSTNVEIIPIPEIGYQDVITRAPDQDLPGPSVAGEKFIVAKGKRIVPPEKYDLVIQTFRALGVATGIGLPMDRYLEDDGLYKLAETNDAIMGHRIEPTLHQVYARALLEMSYLASLYGEARVLYVAVQAMRGCIYELVARHVRGPSRRIN